MDKDKNLYLGVDVGGTKISGGIVNKNGDILYSLKCATPLSASPQEVARTIKILIEDILENYGITFKRIKGIGMGIPGVVRPNRRDILVTPNINLTGFPLAEYLEKAFKAKVVLGNDVNVGILAEKYFGAGGNSKDVVGIFLGTGVGGAIIINGHLVEGAVGAAGELGHMIIDLKSNKTSAGLFGTLESLIGRRSIERDIRAALKKRKKTIITELLDKDYKVIKSSILARALKAKDPLVMGIFDEVCEVLGKACISIRHILNPNMIILGGGIIEACGDYILPRVQKISAANPFLKGLDNCKIARSFLGDDAIILGGAVLVRQSLGETISLHTRYYPELKLSRNNRIMINGKPHKPNFFIRADGELKMLNGQKFLEPLKKKNQIDLNILRKLCKKNPKTLIVGSVKPKKITDEGRQFLNEKFIKYKIVSLPQAIHAYNINEERKALILS